eukprot:5644003-Amphidinium_carterae.1
MWLSTHFTIDSDQNLCQGDRTPMPGYGFTKTPVLKDGTPTSIGDTDAEEGRHEMSNDNNSTKTDRKQNAAHHEQQLKITTACNLEQCK